MFDIITEDILMHYGMPRRSGRYPWGSGENPYQHSADFLAKIDELKKNGFSEKQIADFMGLTTTQLRVQKSLAKNERRELLVDTAKGLREKGYSLNEIAEKMGFQNDSSVRSLLNEEAEHNMMQAQVTANFLKDMIDEKGMIDVGAGVERELGISKEKLAEALYILELQGYPTYGGGVPQVTNKGKQTNLKVVCPPGTEHKEIYDFDQISSVRDYDKVLSEDGTKVRPAFEYPESMDSKRLGIRYAEDGGIEKDGLIEIRRGCPDLSLGESHYAQVRILVDGTHYLKGMAVYSDDLPKGVDVVFNTNKSKGTPALGPKDNTVLKNISKDDPNNPFGSLIKEHGGQSYYMKDGKEHLSLINKRSDEGDWDDWSDHLPSQFLGKQSLSLIKKQLGLSLSDKKDEYSEISSLTNPTVKKMLLSSFADDCDAAAVHLKAAALPRQKYQVIIPLPSLKDNEVYAPNYKNGEKVALIRYPHGGTFEIPIVTVNNKSPEGNKVLGAAVKDAVGINSKVAARLSGADFDGDTVMVIPVNSRVKINSTPPLKRLEGFDAKLEYGPGSTDKAYKRMKNTQTEMGKISNLITDMTLKGASSDELARAVRHSMVVIDAEKHNLDYKRSEKDNAIDSLKKKYQGRIENGVYREGASTLLSRAKGEVSVNKRRGTPIINPDGSLSYKDAADLYYTDKNGKVKTRTQQSTQMAETKDARKLSSGTPQEELYAAYANECKRLANEARKQMINTSAIKYSKSAANTYRTEVAHLDAQLNVALKNAPRERQAQIMANSIVKAKKQANPDMKKEDIKKLSQRALTEARVKVGAKRVSIEPNEREIEAIQAGAISEHKLTQILKYTNIDTIREHFTPRAKATLSTAKINKLKAMKASGYTTSEIAQALNVSTSTVSKYL